MTDLNFSVLTVIMTFCVIYMCMCILQVHLHFYFLYCIGFIVISCNTDNLILIFACYFLHVTRGMFAFAWTLFFFFFSVLLVRDKLASPGKVLWMWRKVV